MLQRQIAPYNAAVVLALLAWPAPAHLLASDGAVEFNRDIRPLLSDNCFQCHGPDQAKRKAELRLDIESAALALNDGAVRTARPIVPGDPAASELYRRIASTDADEQMPPADSGRKLSAEQIELVRRWIEQGAKWQGHWSFIPPRRPACRPSLLERECAIRSTPSCSRGSSTKGWLRRPRPNGRRSSAA